MITFLLKNKTAILIVVAATAVAGSFVANYHRGYDNGFNDANTKAQKFTEEAMRGLSTDANAAARDFLTCRNAGRLWDFGTNQCSTE